MNENKARELGQAVHHWLAFQSLCGRVPLFSEAYLSQPVGEFCLSHHSGSLEPEWTIPDLRSGAPGRPKQVDYVLKSRDTKRLTAAVEAKFIGPSTVDTQRIVDDLLRLERIRDPSGQMVHRYFIVAGRTVDFDARFIGRTDRTDGGNVAFLPPVLDLQNEDRKDIDIEQVGDAWNRLFLNFSSDYGVDIPRGLVTKLLAYQSSDAISVALWRVLSRRNRQPFQHQGV